MNPIRKTSQYLLPLIKNKRKTGGYDLYPTHNLEPGMIHADFASLAKAISGHKQVIIDGYQGVRFNDFISELNSVLAFSGIEPLWWNCQTAMKNPEEIDQMISPFLGGDDPLFGFRATLNLMDFFRPDKLENIRPDDSAPVNILYGHGAALAGWEGLLIYIDIPKNEIQFRSRAGSVTNLGASSPLPPGEMYKRSYFVDWVVLNRHKKEILNKIDIIIDGQREKEITWMSGQDLRAGLNMLSDNAFRVRPWFEPGIWGGQWIKEHIEGLSEDVPNYGWSFELIVPENGIIFSSDDRLLEVSFDTLMYHSGEKVVGKACYDTYRDEFPIRMDYLDNFDGGNLSIQCHPQLEYIRENFGEVLTQEETYYLLDTKDDAVVYLGFKEDIVPEEFEGALYESYANATPLDVEKFVHQEKAKKHDLFLIPPGTIHSSGRNNLVLEISTTPYIFTFKMYDWLARDLDGKPRSLNIKRAMENLSFERKGDYVTRKLVSHPEIMETGPGWQLESLPTHEKHSYLIFRYTLNTEVQVSTGHKCNVLNLVEGDKAEIHTAGGKIYELSYGETVVVSAAAGAYTIVNTSGKPIKMVKVNMK
jgi:mannose-6-phosphate isomerase class I